MVANIYKNSCHQEKSRYYTGGKRFLVLRFKGVKKADQAVFRFEDVQFPQ